MFPLVCCANAVDDATIEHSTIIARMIFLICQTPSGKTPQPSLRSKPKLPRETGSAANERGHSLIVLLGWASQLYGKYPRIDPVSCRSSQQNFCDDGTGRVMRTQ